MPVPIVTLNHDGVKLSTILRQPCLFRSCNEYSNAARLFGVISSRLWVHCAGGTAVADYRRGIHIEGVPLFSS